MPSTSAGRSQSPHNAYSGRPLSLLSRIKAPFATKTRHMGDFFVQPDDPHRQYGPGDVITGTVVLQVLKPLRVTHITLCLHGFVQVYRAANNPGESYKTYTGTSIPGKTMRTGYFGNGFASLFVDEVALCGEGRLGEGTYQFGFELVFPQDRQPSSINFERGTIAYMITCTLTKPTTIAPTVICDREVKYGEDVDIATLRQPKPHVITLEPINKRGRSSNRARKRGASAVAGTLADGEQPRISWSVATTEGTATQRGSAAAASQADGETPISPAPSEISYASCMSSCATSSAVESAAHSALSNGGSKSSHAQHHHHHHHHSSQHPISTNIEISRAGFLRGDTVQIRVNIQHRKVVRSLHGVVVTLYRQARVDMHPALPIVGRDGKEGKNEDYYPRSKTGLGGLSLSAAGSTHVFRKDLSQSFASLIVNPETLVADVKAAVRVPDEAFPSITSVPGGMISFKYYVEVILDIQGKLSGLDRLFPSAGTQYGPGAGINIADGETRPGMSAWGGHFVDTQDLRRGKGIISSLFEIVVGTRDSERAQGSSTRLTQTTSLSPAEPAPSQAGAAQSQQTNQHTDQDPAPYDYDSRAQYELEQWQYGDYSYGNGYGDGYDAQEHEHLYGPGPLPTHSVPLPDLSEEDQLPEKERIRRAEARLLPSQPPDGDEPESSAAADRFAPSAPALETQHHLQTARAQGETPANAAQNEHSSEEQHMMGTLAAPAYSGASRPARALTDDKQELQRQRLEMERSAPDDDAADDETAGPSASSGSNRDDGDDDLTPSAPVLHDHGDDHYIGASSLPLPRYER